MTLHQPWASLVAVGAKKHETRSGRPGRLLGQRIAIHAAARRTLPELTDEALDAITEAFGTPDWKHSLPRGVVLCTAIISETAPAEKVPPDHFGDYSPGRWAWRLEDVRAVRPPVPALGTQTWGWAWHVPEEVEL